MIDRYDVVVVGGGTAGCVVAARLSEDPDRRVLLLEAGPDYPQGEVPGAVTDARYVPMRGHAPNPDPVHDWGLDIVGPDGGSIAVPQGRLVGGGSAINGMISLRGATADYAEWEAAGNPDWGWQQVLPAFRALEDDTAPGDDIHGRGGPWPIERAHEAEYAPLQGSFVRTCRTLGYEDCHDFNAPDATGVGPAPMARRGTRRISAAEAYLGHARMRPNLTVRGESQVDRVELDDTRAVGVRLVSGEVVHAEETVLCAGAILSPTILQRSGVGPAAVLSEARVPVVADLPVGERLGDHFAVPVLAVPRAGAWSPGDFSLQTAVRFSTQAQPGSLDGQLLMFTYLNVRTTGRDGGTRGLAGQAAAGAENVGGVGCVLNKPRSIGTVRITSGNAAQLPRVVANYLTEDVDRLATREIVRRGWDVLRAEPLRSMLHEPMGLDQHTVEDDDALDAAIREKAASGYHFVGTCRMAPAERDGVVDQAGRVHGMAGLRVADASVIPTVPAANTMLPTVMTAERLAAAMRARA